MTTAGAQGVRVSPKHHGEGSTPSRPAYENEPVLPHVGYSCLPDSETRRGGPARKFHHVEAACMRAAGHSWTRIARHYGVTTRSVRDAVSRVPRHMVDVARSPVPSPPAADDHGTPGAGVDTATPPGGETTGLRGAPADHPTTPARERKERVLVEAGAPIVREQHDPDGDLWYCLTLPSGNHHATTSRTHVDSLLAPWDSMAVVWIQED